VVKARRLTLSSSTSFDGKANKEIWVNSGERKVYTSLEDAQKAREANPCK